MKAKPKNQIRVTIDADGMGDRATVADYNAYARHVQLRLSRLYPECSVTVIQQPYGVSGGTQVYDESVSGDVSEVLTVLWEEFCANPSLWNAPESA